MWLPPHVNTVLNLSIILFPLLLQITTSTKKFTLFPFKEAFAKYEAWMLLIVLLVYSEIQPFRDLFDKRVG